MIPYAYINEWRQNVLWQTDNQIEQDLVISRILVEIFSHPEINSSVAFRGGTALNKLYFRPPLRYSEDIDLVQIRAEPIGQTLNMIRSVIDEWLGSPSWKIKHGRVTLYYRYPSAENPNIKLRLKLEINTREHFSAFERLQIPFVVKSSWYNGETTVNTYQLNELLGTKLRALYQRNKGRDLFDIWYASQHKAFDKSQMLEAFYKYLAFTNTKISRAEFEKNIALKLLDAGFISDIRPLIANGAELSTIAASSYLRQEILPLLPGDPWRGEAHLNALEST